jgi:hypothetical protein
MFRVEHPLQHPGFIVHADSSQLTDTLVVVALGALSAVTCGKCFSMSAVFMFPPFFELHFSQCIDW